MHRNRIYLIATVATVQLLVLPAARAHTPSPIRSNITGAHYCRIHSSHHVPASHSPLIATVTDFSGTVTIVRHRLSKPIPVSVGTQVASLDTVAVGPSSTVSVECLGCLRQFRWTSGDHSVDCSGDQTQGYLEKIRQADQTAGTISDDHGNQVARAKGIDTEGCLAAIIKSRGSSWLTGISMRGTPPLLTASQVESLRNEILAGSDGSSDSQHYLVAEVYALRQNYDGAIDQLQQISSSHTHDPGVQILLGDLLLAGTYGRSARDAYMTAITSAENRHDVLAEAVACHAMAYYETLIQDMPIADNTNIEKAANLYRQAGDFETAAGLAKGLQAALSE